MQGFTTAVVDPLARLTCLAVMAIAPAWLAIADEDDDSDDQETMSVMMTIRDFPPDSGHPDFTVSPAAIPGVRSAKNVAMTLDAQYKPVYEPNAGKAVVDEWKDSSGRDIAWCAPPVSSPADVPGSFGADDDGGITSQDTFAQWFRDVPGVNMSRLGTINLTKNDQGIWCFDTSNFNPIDEQLLGNGPDEQNFYFTCEIVCTFVYDDDDDQFFRFEGDDDCWVFIDGKLAIDHGGIASGRTQRIDLNRMGLSDGQTYALHFFMAERYQPQTQFHIKTNVDLTSAGSESVFAMFD